MSAVVPIEVNVDQILNVALLGVRRASMFIGLGVNAAQSDACNQYQLTRITQIQLLPDGLDVQALKEAKDEFRLWIEANGFRELIETFHVFLDAISLACLKFKFGKGVISIAQLKAKQSAFSKQGFPRKLDILNEEYSIAAKNRDHLVSLNSARNVFTHRLSVVRRKDLNAGEFMRMSWLGSDIFIQESNGTRHPIEEVIAQQQSFPEETSLMMQFNTRNRDFREGQRVILSSRDLAEICWFMPQEARALVSSLLDHAKRIGVEVRTSETQQGPAADVGTTRS